MHPGQRRRLRRQLAFTGLGTLTGLAFDRLRGTGAPVLGAATGMAIAAGIIAIQQAIIRTRLGEALRRLPLIASSAIVAVAYSVVILSTVAVAIRLDAGVWRLDTTAIILSLGATVFFTSVNTIGHLVGWRVLRNVLIGRYRQPAREERIFLFLDLAGSTTLAERLGELRVQELIARFYFDIAQPIAAHDGEIYQYRGDEISVIWPLSDERDARCIACAFAIRDSIAARADWYRNAFGTVPEFRIGLHGGPVVAGEVGDERREIMYFGDTINVAARIQALAKREGRAVCISGDLLARLDLPAGVQATPLGSFQLQGKQQRTEVFSLTTA
jgi:class 3 adenylate cyclase